MKILVYSDLHLEFKNSFLPPKNSDVDLMVLAGDIIIFDNFKPLEKFLQGWHKPVLFVEGNHEYYTRKSMAEARAAFKRFCTTEPCLLWLQNQDFEMNDVQFFGGTMWTDFNKSNPHSMMLAHRGMNDFREIFLTPKQPLYPAATVEFHEVYKKNLIEWLKKNEGKKGVVISHHAPCLNPKSNYKDSKLRPAYNSLDMLEIIHKYQPELWIYGHTHESDDQMIGKTRIVSNPFGYYKYQENPEFNPNFIIEI